MTLVVKTDPSTGSGQGGGPLALTGQARDAIRSIDRNLPTSDTLDPLTFASVPSLPLPGGVDRVLPAGAPGGFGGSNQHAAARLEEATFSGRIIIR